MRNSEEYMIETVDNTKKPFTFLDWLRTNEYKVGLKIELRRADRFKHPLNSDCDTECVVSLINVTAKVYDEINEILDCSFDDADLEFVVPTSDFIEDDVISGIRQLALMLIQNRKTLIFYKPTQKVTIFGNVRTVYKKFRLPHFSLPTVSETAEFIAGCEIFD